MSSDIKNSLVLGAIFLFLFLLLTPLKIFNDWIPPQLHTGYFSVTQIDGGDDAGYYAYLRSGFFDGDWDFVNEGHYSHVENFTPTGYVFNNWQIGQSLLFLPFFLAGHLVAVIYNNLGYPVSVDGYSAPYYMATAVASQTYLFAGLLLLFHILKRRFGSSIALIATLAIWLGSPLVYYTFIRQRMAHTIEFFLAVVFIWMWLKERNSEDYFKHAILGGILGFLCMVRVINMGFFVLYLIDQLLLINNNKSSSSIIQFKTLIARCFCFSGFWILVFMPQLFAWYKIEGIPLPALHSNIAGSLASSLSIGDVLNKIRSMFFGPRWGLVFSSPLILIGFCGLMIPNEGFKRSRLSLITVGLTFIAIVIFLYNYLDAYEFRYLTPVLPVFAIGLAVILNRLSKNIFSFYLAMVFCLMCVLAQYFMLVQYKVTLLYNDPEFTVKALGEIPSLIINQPQLLLRSTNFIRLVCLDHPQPWNYNDFLFLIAFPLSQLVCVVLVIVGFQWAAYQEKTTFKLRAKYATGGAVLMVLSLVVLIGFLTPSKTKREINNRKIFAELMKKGDAFSTTKKTDEAINFYTKAYFLVPNNTTLLFKLGVVYREKGELGMSNEYYRKALTIYPNHIDTLLNLGLGFFYLKNYEKAESNLKSAIRTRPDIAKLYDALALVYMAKNQEIKVLKMYRIAFNVDPNYFQARINMAVFLYKINRHEEALQQTEELISKGVLQPMVLKLAKIYGLPTL